ncbi:FixH family protein [Rossellomorea sp. BNER]|uniref:FixH family protein n=1 Tax=Rossellomorea sp. BNER TaxID=2962031 RepID=UPI003AF1FC94|nr:FixH family protein [Rossellomorea sp. BNER]
MKHVKHFVLLAIVVVLTACTANAKEGQDGNRSLEPLKAEIQVPENIKLMNEINLKVKVTQGSDIVQDASEVMFEIWHEKGKEESIMLEAKHDQNGIYSASTTFEKSGTYYVQPHVTARNMHVMPKVKVIVNEKESN